MTDYCLYVGIDSSDQEHEVQMLTSDGTRDTSLKITHTGRDIRRLIDRLQDRAGDLRQVAVAIERPHGPVVEMLLERGCHVYSLNPKQLDRFRDRHTASGAHDDRFDAYVLADCLRNDRHTLRRCQLSDPRTIQLRDLGRETERLKKEVRRHANRVRDHLWRYFPQPLKFCPGADEAWLWDLLDRAPTPERAAGLKRVTLTKLLRRHRIRRFTAEELHKAVREERMRVADGVTQAAARIVRSEVAMLRVMTEQLGQIEHEIERLLKEIEREAEAEMRQGQHPDIRIIDSMPGVGPVVLATMLAEAAQALAERDLHRLRTETGVAPITKRSGKSIAHLMRRACNRRLRCAVFCWGLAAIKNDAVCRARYDAMRARGLGHARALRGIIDSLLRVLVAMLRDGTLYDPDLRRQPQPPMTTGDEMMAAFST